MPELPFDKARPHPYKNGNTSSKHRLDGLPNAAAKNAPQNAPQALPLPAVPTYTPAEPAYAELLVRSNFSFLTGSSHPDELVNRAADLGLHAIALADDGTLAGIVRAHIAAKARGVRFIPATRITPVLYLPPADRQRDDELPATAFANWSLVLLPTSMAGYSAICNLLTLGKSRAPKARCYLTLHDLIDALLTPRGRDVQIIFVPPVWHPACPPDESFIRLLADLNASLHPAQPRVDFASLSPQTVPRFAAHGRAHDHARLFLAASCMFDGHDQPRHTQLLALSTHTGVPLVAAADALYHDPSRRELADVLTATRLKTTVAQAGFALQHNSQRHLRSGADMLQRFAHLPGAVANTMVIADRCQHFSLDQIKYQYPDETVPKGVSPMEHLIDLTWRGAAERYGISAFSDHADIARQIPQSVARQIRHECVLIDELHYAHYFLTVHDIVAFARSKKILCQGRGAAANSAVCFCLGITSVDPANMNVLFERFISKERSEPPDIDVDFEHERREEVIQYIYGKYGRHRAALTAVVISYRGRSAAREVGKALGLSADTVETIAKTIDWWEPGVPKTERLAEIGLTQSDPTIVRLLGLVQQLLGFPRHLSQHVGGFIMTQTPLCDLVPIENARMADRTVVEWDKDDIDALGMLKVDVLALGMLTCVRKALDMVNVRRPHAPLHLANIPASDTATYDMICKADTVGVFQIESRAQMSMLPRLRPRCYYDLVIQVAIVRPGPIQGDMVHPYLRRRDGLEPVTFPSESVRTILGRTLGVPLFQEQAMSLAISCAGFSPGEADQLRRAIAAWKTKQKIIYSFGQKITAGMVSRGYEPEFAERVFNQIKGFSEYGFPESHAASFAHIVYASAYIKCHYPAEFAAALINSQPMGFYAPAQIISDARRHGVMVQPIDVNHSAWDCTVSSAGKQGQLRLGLRLACGLQQHEAARIASAVARHGLQHSIASLRKVSGVSLGTLRTLARADAFGSMNLSRQHALFAIAALKDDNLPLFAGLAEPDTGGAGTAHITLPVIAPQLATLHDYAATGFSLKAHPISFLRPRLAAARCTPCEQLADPLRTPHGSTISVAGLVLVRQRPHTAKGVMFITIEDESGHANLILWPDIFERFRATARHAGTLIAKGVVQRERQVVHVLVKSVAAADEHLGILQTSRDFR